MAHPPKFLMDATLVNQMYTESGATKLSPQQYVSWLESKVLPLYEQHVAKRRKREVKLQRVQHRAQYLMRLLADDVIKELKLKHTKTRKED